MNYKQGESNKNLLLKSRAAGPVVAIRLKE
jgi:hypothetical protein